MTQIHLNKFNSLNAEKHLNDVNRIYRLFWKKLFYQETAQFNIKLYLSEKFQFV